MAAANTDYFNKVGRSTATTLSAPGYTIGNTSINVGSTTNWPSDTGVTFAIDTVGSDGLRVAGTYNVFRGTVNTATQITNVTYVGGDANQNYSAGSTTRVYILVSSYRDNRFTDGILVDHDQQGRHKNLTDANGNEWIKQTATASAVNEFTIANAATGNAPVLSVTGDDTNVDLKLTPKGSGQVVFGGRYDGWSTGALPAVSSVTANGNRSYDITFASTVASTLSSDMRLRTTRTVAAPTTSFSLDGSNDYYNDTSVSGMTFTDDFVAGAWIKLNAYPTTDAAIITRYNGTSGWTLAVNSVGQLQLAGFNAGAVNFSRTSSYQSVPLDRWVHVAAQLDMSSFTASSTTGYVMFDGKDIPASVTRSGTNPTALVQAGNLEVGSYNSGTNPFNGKITDVFVTSAKVTQANIATIYAQGLTAAAVSTHSMVSAYTNGSTTDLNTTNANNLTAQNGATTATAAPYGNNGASSTLDYALVQAVSTTVATVQVPEGCTIPTSGGVTSVAYSVQAAPFGFVTDRGRWRITSHHKGQYATTSNATYGAFSLGAMQLVAPVGAFKVGYSLGGSYAQNVTTHWGFSPTALTGLTNSTGANVLNCINSRLVSSAAAATAAPIVGSIQNTFTTAQTYVMYTLGATTASGVDASTSLNELYAEPTGL